MTIMTVYVKGTKKAINQQLDNGVSNIRAVSYSLYGDSVHNLRDVPDGTVIKFWEKMVSGTPYAKSYGTWNATKGRVK